MLNLNPSVYVSPWPGARFFTIWFYLSAYPRVKPGTSQNVRNVWDSSGVSSSTEPAWVFLTLPPTFSLGYPGTRYLLRNWALSPVPVPTNPLCSHSQHSFTPFAPLSQWSSKTWIGMSHPCCCKLLDDFPHQIPSKFFLSWYLLISPASFPSVIHHSLCANFTEPFASTGKACSSLSLLDSVKVLN
jgi:hypothetical protein